MRRFGSYNNNSKSEDAPKNKCGDLAQAGVRPRGRFSGWGCRCCGAQHCRGRGGGAGSQPLPCSQRSIAVIGRIFLHKFLLDLIGVQKTPHSEHGFQDLYRILPGSIARASSRAYFNWFLQSVSHALYLQIHAFNTRKHLKNTSKPSKTPRASARSSRKRPDARKGVRGAPQGRRTCARLPFRSLHALTSDPRTGTTPAE